MSSSLHFLSAFILLAYLLVALTGKFNRILNHASVILFFKSAIVLQTIFLFFFLYDKGGIAFVKLGDYIFALSYVLPLTFALMALNKAPTKLIAIVSASTFLLFSSSGYLVHISNNFKQPFFGTWFLLIHVFPLIVGEVAFISAGIFSLYYLNQERIIKTQVKLLKIDSNGLSLEILSRLIKLSANIGLIGMSLGALSGYLAFPRSLTKEVQYSNTSDFSIWLLLCCCITLFSYILCDWQSYFKKISRITFLAYSTIVLTLTFMSFRIFLGNFSHGL